MRVSVVVTRWSGRGGLLSRKTWIIRLKMVSKYSRTSFEVRMNLARLENEAAISRVSVNYR
jgi:hypothetical protein